jgi:hypothetical protein
LTRRIGLWLGENKAPFPAGRRMGLFVSKARGEAREEKKGCGNREVISL